MIYQSGYKTVAGYECMNASLLNYMKFCGKCISSSDIYLSIEGSGVCVNNTLFFYESNVHLNGLFLKQNHIDYSYGHCKKNMEKFLEEHILNNKMIAIVVKSKYLSYSRWFQHAGNSGHYVNVIGKKNNKFYISDGYVLNGEGRVFEGWLESEQVLEAWKEKNYQYIVYNNDFGDLCEKSVIEKANKRLLEILLPYCKSTGSMEDYLGFEVIKKIFFNVEILLNDKEKCYNMIYGIVYNLRWGGFLTIKYFLIDKLNALNVNRIYIKKYENIMQKWNAICMALIKIGIKPDKKTYYKLLKMVEQVCKSEKELLCDVYYNCL